MMKLWNVIENDTVVNVIIADTIDLVPYAEGQIVEEHTGQAFVGYQKINGVWLHPNEITKINENLTS